MAPQAPHTLDGMAYMQYAAYVDDLGHDGPEPGLPRHPLDAGKREGLAGDRGSQPAQPVPLGLAFYDLHRSAGGGGLGVAPAAAARQPARRIGSATASPKSTISIPPPTWELPGTSCANTTCAISSSGSKSAASIPAPVWRNSRLPTARCGKRSTATVTPSSMKCSTWATKVPDMLAFLSWYLLVSLAGWLAFPLAYRLLPALSRPRLSPGAHPGVAGVGICLLAAGVAGRLAQRSRRSAAGAGDPGGAQRFSGMALLQPDGGLAAPGVAAGGERGSALPAGVCRHGVRARRQPGDPGHREADGVGLHQRHPALAGIPAARSLALRLRHLLLLLWLRAGGHARPPGWHGRRRGVQPGRLAGLRPERRRRLRRGARPAQRLRPAIESKSRPIRRLQAVALAAGSGIRPAGEQRRGLSARAAHARLVLERRSQRRAYLVLLEVAGYPRSEPAARPAFLLGANALLVVVARFARGAGLQLLRRSAGDHR